MVIRGRGGKETSGVGAERKRKEGMSAAAGGKGGGQGKIKWERRRGEESIAVMLEDIGR